MRFARHAWIAAAGLALAATQVAVAAEKDKPPAQMPPVQQHGAGGGQAMGMSMGSDKSMGMMDMPMMKEHMAQMREHMQKMQSAKSMDERQRLMQEHMQMMDDHMGMMMRMMETMHGTPGDKPAAPDQPPHDHNHGK